AFCARAERVYHALDRPFMRERQPSVRGLVSRSGWRGLSDLVHMKPFSTLWREIGKCFGDARLQQLFARYATYCGSSPFEAPATLMLIAHVERLGVWQVEGGLHRIASMLAALAAQRGAKLHFEHRVAAVIARSGAVHGIALADGDRLDADAVIFNGDASALARGLLGPAAAAAVPLWRRAPPRSLSALTWNLVGATSGFELAHHNVFFSDAYAQEFVDIAQGHMPAHPTVYVCAQDQGDALRQGAAPAQRLLCLVNAPARGDAMRPDAQEIRRCEQTSFEHLARCGLRIERRPSHTVTTTPTQFHRLFPGTGGALYGAATHGWRAAFRRPGSRTRLRGFYLAGGSVHPGPGLPMVALSGRMAADSVLRDLAFRTSVSGWHPVDMPGGTSTR
ncbi:MAG TPA: FAD-dependent oxidoreductase, partial [Burkholderiaceae bacterium]|nr:FAD-dependent oxidoreductase [Burkholderiaceae bacterium]